MSIEASANGLLDAACDTMEAAVTLAKEEESRGEKIKFKYEHEGKRITSEILEKLMKTARKVHDHYLDTKGMKSRAHRAHQLPFDKKLKKKKKFKKGFKLENPILGRDTYYKFHNLAERDQNANHELNFKSEVQMDELCRGAQIRSLEERSKLYCTYVHGGSPWLRLGPIKQEINAFDPFHVV